MSQNGAHAQKIKKRQVLIFSHKTRLTVLLAISGLVEKGGLWVFGLDRSNFYIFYKTSPHFYKSLDLPPVLRLDSHSQRELGRVMFKFK